MPQGPPSRQGKVRWGAYAQPLVCPPLQVPPGVAPPSALDRPHLSPSPLLQSLAMLHLALHSSRGALRANDDRLPHQLDPEENTAPSGLPPSSSLNNLGSLAPKGCEGLAPALGSDYSSRWLFLQTPHSLLLPGLSN